VKTSTGLESRPTDRPARSQSLYRLNYRGSHNIVYFPEIKSLVVRIVLNSPFAYYLAFEDGADMFLRKGR
jgi:hypothetical protein